MESDFDADDVTWDDPKEVTARYAIVYPDMDDGWTIPWTWEWDAKTNEWTYHKHNRHRIEGDEVWD